MVLMSAKKWPDQVPVLTPARLSNGTVVNLLARADGLIVYVAAAYPSPSAPPTLIYGRAPATELEPLEQVTHSEG